MCHRRPPFILLPQIFGVLPASLGNLTGLVQLQGNQITSGIPTQLGNLTALNVLNLRSNRLVGPVPSSFINLTALDPGSLNLAWNALRTTDPVLDGFLYSRHSGGDWSVTQTVAPANLGEMGGSGERTLRFRVT